MKVSEEFVKVCGEIGAFTKQKTGISVVDAYFGPEELHPEKQRFDEDVDSLLIRIASLADRIRDEVADELRQEYMIGEITSLRFVVDWLRGADIPYPDLVEGLFGFRPKKFSDSIIDRNIGLVEESLEEFPGDSLLEKVTLFNAEGEITGEPLKELVLGDLQDRAAEVGTMFRDRVFAVMGSSVPDNGVVYEAVNDQPWSGYNWYQGEFKSLNQFNVDVTFNQDTIRGVIYHEYEHHVSNLWREQYYRNTGHHELSIVPLHTGRCVISEGTADTAKEFLGIHDDDPRTQVVNALYSLRRMTSINAAIMLNHEKKSEEEAVEYMIEKGYRTEKSAKGSIGFISHTAKDGRPNFWAPYVLTYFIGRTDYVLPAFVKAKEQGEIAEFFKTIYLNQYSGSSLTWKKAFEWLN